MKHHPLFAISIVAFCAILFLNGCAGGYRPGPGPRPGTPSPQQETSPRSAHVPTADYKKIGVIVPAGGRAQGFETIIETAFLDVLLAKGYDLVTRQSLDQVAKELVRTKDDAFDATTAAEIGKLANASHIIVVRLPWFQEKHNPKTGTSTCDMRITAQVIAVQNGRIARVAQDNNKFTDNLNPFEPHDPASMVEKVARRVAQRLP